MKNLVIKTICILIALITNLQAQTTLLKEDFENQPLGTITSMPSPFIYNQFTSSCNKDLWFITDYSNSTYTCSASNSVRGLSAGDAANNDAAIDAVTIATTGNAVDFGDMATTVGARQGCSSPLKMAIMGGGAPAYSSNCEFVTISTFGNGVDFGNASAAWGYSQNFSNSHGGLA